MLEGRRTRRKAGAAQRILDNAPCWTKRTLRLNGGIEFVHAQHPAIRPNSCSCPVETGGVGPRHQPRSAPSSCGIRTIITCTNRNLDVIRIGLLAATFRFNRISGSSRARGGRRKRLRSLAVALSDGATAVRTTVGSRADLHGRDLSGRAMVLLTPATLVTGHPHIAFFLAQGIRSRERQSDRSRLHCAWLRDDRISRSWHVVRRRVSDDG